MEKYIIYNAVPSYEEEMEAVNLLRDRPGIVLEDLKARGGEGAKGYLILPKGAGALAAKMPPELTCLEADVRSGFVYQNGSALKKVIEGEKAIPSQAGLGDSWRHVASLADEKKICVKKQDGTIVSLPFQDKMTLEDLVKAAGEDEGLKAVCLGHPSGRILGKEELGEALPPEVSFVRLIGEDRCMLDELLKIAALYRKETCGRCVFGHEGSAQIYMILSDIAQKKGRATDIDLLQELCETMLSQTLCEVGVSLARSVLDGTAKFRDEISQHILKKSCPAGVCAKFVTYHILAAKCVGCGDCMDACGEDAILGKKRFVHVIDQEECIQCGECESACEEGAVVKAGAVKPRCPARPVPCKR